MPATRRALVVVAIALAACRGDGPAEDAVNEPGLERASSTIRSVVDATAAAALPDAGWEVDSLSRENDGLVPCTDDLGGFTDEVTRHYGVQTALPDGQDARAVAEAARAFWEREGYGTVDADELSLDDRQEYAIYLTGDGYNYEFLVDLRGGIATVGGSTPCLPEPDGH